MELPPEKSETMIFSGQDPVRIKVIVDNKCLQQVKNFKYFGCEISYEDGKDIQQKLAKFAEMLGIFNITFNSKLVQKFSGIKLYNTLALPIRLFGSKNWTLRKKTDINRDGIFQKNSRYTIF